MLEHNFHTKKSLFYYSKDLTILEVLKKRCEKGFDNFPTTVYY